MDFMIDTPDVVKKAAKGVYDSAVSSVVSGADYVGDKVSEGAEYIGDAAVAVGNGIVSGFNYTLTKAQQAGRAVKDGVAYVYDESKKTFTAIKVGATVALCEAARTAKFVTAAAWNELVNQVASVGAYKLSDPDIDAQLRELVGYFSPDPNADQGRDGERIEADDCGCKIAGGILPSNCSQKPGTLPKAHYINGINTNIAGHCATLENLATALCKEVCGTYNATSGIGGDVVECVDNIRRSATVPATNLAGEILANLGKDPPQEMDLYAHSQGGLVTQHAVIEVKNKLTADYAAKHYPGRNPTATEKAAAQQDTLTRMAKLKINSFGTAVMGWPEGPRYESYTNLADPVPRVIISAQLNHMAETFTDGKILSSILFEEPYANPIRAHSMDEVYIPRMKAARPPPNCLCK